jgi:hypothetical protein
MRWFSWRGSWNENRNVAERTRLLCQRQRRLQAQAAAVFTISKTAFSTSDATAPMPESGKNSAMLVGDGLNLLVFRELLARTAFAIG